MNVVSKAIAYYLSEGKISPAFGRFLEIAAYSTIAAVAAYGADKLTQGVFPNAKELFFVAITAFLSYVAKSARDVEKAAANSVE